MSYPIESSFAEKLSLGGSEEKMTKKPESKLDQLSDVNRPSEKATSNAMSDDDYDYDHETDVNRLATSTPQKKLDTDTDTDTNADTSHYYSWLDEDIFSNDSFSPEVISDDDEVRYLRPFTMEELTEAWEKGEDPLTDLFYRECEKFPKLGPKYANAGVSYMREKGHNLELVKPGLFHSSNELEVERIHFNFEAKRADDPDAPVETYFGQLHDHWDGDPALIVDCCVPVPNPAPPMERRDTQGCKICSGGLVHHPVGVAGCEGIDLGPITMVMLTW